MAETFKSNLGCVTAYGYAKQGGYSGTAEQFEADLARYADSAADIIAAADAVADAIPTLNQYVTDASGYASAASTSATNASVSETNASNSANAASASEQNAKTSEDNAKQSEDNASTSETNAAASETAANGYKNEAQTYANSASASASASATSEANASASEAAAVQSASEAATSAQQAADIAQGLSGALLPMGTITFEDLPSNPDAGWMYNISNEFTTTNDFKEGSGHVIPAGSNVYRTADGYWDVLAGSPVSGVKGDSETIYRRGNVNITKANIGLGNVDNTADADKSVSYANTAGNATQFNGHEASYYATQEDLTHAVDQAKHAEEADSLSMAGTIQVNLASSVASTYTDGGNITPGVSGVLPVANGGTGVTDLSQILITMTDVQNYVSSLFNFSTDAINPGDTLESGHFYFQYSE